MQIITEDQARERLDDPRNASGKLVPYYRGGRKPGDLNIPDPIRKIIGVCASAGHGSVKATAKEFGISAVRAAHLRDGLLDGKNVDADLKKSVDALREQVAVDALDKLMVCLGLVTEEALSGLEVGKALSAAKDLSQIAKNMDKDKVEFNNNGVIVYVTPVKKEEQYEVVEV